MANKLENPGDNLDVKYSVKKLFIRVCGEGFPP